MLLGSALASSSLLASSGCHKLSPTAAAPKLFQSPQSSTIMASRPPSGLPPPSPRTGVRRRNVPPSPRTRGILYRKISSVIEGSFLDDGVGISGPQSALRPGPPSPRFGRRISGSLRPSSVRKGEYEERTNLTQLVPNQAVTDSIRLPTKKPTSERPVVSFVVVYTMIFFNGCE